MAARYGAKPSVVIWNRWLLVAWRKPSMKTCVVAVVRLPNA
jgi:hypothetical protein